MAHLERNYKYIRYLNLINQLISPPGYQRAPRRITG